MGRLIQLMPTRKKGGGVDHLDGGGEDSEAPGGGEGEGREQEAGATAKLEDLAGQKAAKEGSQQREARNPRALLGCDVKIRRRGTVGGGGGAIAAADCLQRGDGRGGVAFGQAHGEGAKGHCQHNQDLK
jgi:hypothetical protein